MTSGFAYKRTTNSADETKRLAATLAAHVKPGDIVELIGDLGAGKTQFVQGAAEALGVTADVTSPTFNILLEYHGGRLPVYHFDLYRLDEVSQLDDIAYFEMLEAGGVSFVEWGDKFPEALPCDYLEISLKVDSDGKRLVYVRSFGCSSCQLLLRWANDSKSRLVKTT